LVVAVLGRASDVKLSSWRLEAVYRSARASYLGAVFSLAFFLVLVPWTVRNYRVFHLFQPLAPAHAEMPGEFVPRGYFSWLRTWIDDGRYIGPVLWSLDSAPIKLSDLPDRAFDSAEEKQRVGALLDKYNHPSEEQDLFTDQSDSSNPSDSNGEAKKDEETDQADNDSGDEDDQSDEEDKPDENAPVDQASDQSVEMTPEIDAGFAQLARERVAHQPFRYYVWLPLKRARTLWFDTHSQYYPFEGELLPLDDLDYTIHQQYWLPLFAFLTLIYSLLGIWGAYFLSQTRNFNSQLFVLLAALMVLIRVGFFATLENPEARYVVEVFPFLAILGGLALAQLGRRKNTEATSSGQLNE
jgi:hypothetical protein